MLTDREMRDRMKNGWRQGRPFTSCGNGSLPQNTKNIRSWLPGIFEKYDIRKVADVGAGDQKWMGADVGENEVVGLWGADYFGFDLIPLRKGVKEFDVTSQELELFDAIICRLVLNHLDRPRVEMALDNFKASGSTYLFATQFNRADTMDSKREFNRLDLTEWLGDPLEMARDGNEPHCYLAMWQL